VIKKMGYRWHLRRLMAGKELWQTADLVPLLAERGVTLSREQVFRLVTQPAQRLSMDTLAALCDILDCTPNDLIEIEAVNAEVGNTAGPLRGAGPRCGARRSASPRGGDSSLDGGPAGCTGGADGRRDEFGDHAPDRRRLGFGRRHREGGARGGGAGPGARRGSSRRCPGTWPPTRMR
jgi:DNA-binding Xre family transcriptional regulator